MGQMRIDEILLGYCRRNVEKGTYSKDVTGYGIRLI